MCYVLKFVHIKQPRVSVILRSWDAHLPILSLTMASLWIVSTKPRPKRCLGLLYCLYADVFVLSPARDIFYMARYSLFVLKLPLDTNRYRPLSPYSEYATAFIRLLEGMLIFLRM